MKPNMLKYFNDVFFYELITSFNQLNKYLQFKLKTFDRTYRKLWLSELTSVSSYMLLELRACWWYPWTVVKVVGVGVDSGDLMLENGLIVLRCFGSALSSISSYKVQGY